MNEPSSHPTVRFFQLAGPGRLPQRSDRSAGGTLPTRAFRYCEAATTASALGWYIFPPLGFRLLWTGTETYWTYSGASEWFPLGVAQYPGFRELFDRSAPTRVQGYSPTFLGALPEPGIIQVWSGLVARTKPGWSLLARAPVNLPRSAGFDVFEGVIEADRWFGPLFINIRLTRTGSYIEFDPNLPLFQVQPLERSAYSDAVLDDMSIATLDSFDETEWDAYHETVVAPSRCQRPHGAHAAEMRKRRRADEREAVG